jgi:hypothetical protein
MNAIAEVRPDPNVPGFILTCGSLTVWFAMEVHAINYVQDHMCAAEVLVLNPDGTVHHRYLIGPAG